MEILVFLHKILVWGKWCTLGTKIVHPHDSGSIQKIVFKFCKIKRAKRYMKIVFFTIIFFYGFFEKNLARAILGGTRFILDPKMMHSHNSGSGLRIFLLTLQNERCLEGH